MREYLVHYVDKNDGKVHIFYFLDYNDLTMLMNDLSAMDFEAEYGEVLDIEKVIIDECQEMPAATA